MATSLFQKIRLITLSNLHTVLNAVIDLNSIGAIEQYVRDLQAAHDTLDDQAAVSRSRVKTLPGEIASLHAKHAEADENINILLGDDDPSNDHLAAPLEAKLISLEQQLTLKQTELDATKVELAKYEEAASKIEMRKVEMEGRLEVLRQIDQSNKGKARAEKLLSGVTVGDTPDVDDVERRLREKQAVTDNKLDRTLDRVTGGMGATSTEAIIVARLAKRRAELAKKS
jgi:phage shock protein A